MVLRPCIQGKHDGHGKWPSRHSLLKLFTVTSFFPAAAHVPLPQFDFYQIELLDKYWHFTDTLHLHPGVSGSFT
jgi:hypothetical protein